MNRHAFHSQMRERLKESLELSSYDYGFKFTFQQPKQKNAEELLRELLQ